MNNTHLAEDHISFCPHTPCRQMQTTIPMQDKGKIWMVPQDTHGCPPVYAMNLGCVCHLGFAGTCVVWESSLGDLENSLGRNFEGVCLELLREFDHFVMNHLGSTFFVRRVRMDTDTSQRHRTLMMPPRDLLTVETRPRIQKLQTRGANTMETNTKESRSISINTP
jgi:hypothetical protein